ncbi:MAG: HEAT repeat domain-containing protein [Stigonema ocellatum SAG 48.90 = DSM 106950]|nr:HEAT repeat domain-containing protein [Stigonema ocellatum SAG 48.90 = DSM 106950]
MIIDDQTTAISALIELLQTEYDEETRLKAAECLGTITPGNKDAIAADIELLNTSKNKWTRWQAAVCSVCLCNTLSTRCDRDSRYFRFFWCKFTSTIYSRAAFTSFLEFEDRMNSVLLQCSG